MAELRWDTVELTKRRSSRGQQMLFDDVVERHVGRGAYRGLEFLHVEAQSVVNRTPQASAFPFQYTINAYRGCSHRCSYCLVPDTPVLMADGSIRPIGQIRPGDAVIGTTTMNDVRKYTPATVTDHWQTRKLAYRVSFDDGSEVIASGDHRFLSNRGWKHVTGAEHGSNQRPHLTSNNWILGTIPLPEPPKKGTEYQHGYLSGMIRGDGTIGTHTYSRPDRGGSTVHRFRLALADLPALDRSEQYLADAGVATTRFDFKSDGRPMQAIRAQSKASVDRVRELVEIPEYKSDEWCRGFLAGIFDAEGSASPTSVLRIANRDEFLLAVAAECLNLYSFDWVIDRTRDNEPRFIRFRGGLAEHVRFGAICEPALGRKTTLAGRSVKSSTRRSIESIEPLGLELPMVDITTSTGDFIANGLISHNCFARPTHDYLGLNIGEDFDSKIVVKINAPAVVRHETAPARWAGHPVAMGTNTDPYQHAEGKYKLTRQIIEVLAERKNPFSILTKSPLVLRDLDVLEEAAAVTEVNVDFSVGTLDEAAWASSEPGTAHPRKRIDAVRTLNEAGIRSGVLMGPILPGLSDREDQLEAVIETAVGADARFIAGMYLHLRGPLKAYYLDWLANEHPHLVRRHQQGYATSAYAPPDAAKRLSETIQKLVEKHGGPTRDRTRAPKTDVDDNRSEQLRLIV